MAVATVVIREMHENGQDYTMYTLVCVCVMRSRMWHPVSALQGPNPFGCWTVERTGCFVLVIRGTDQGPKVRPGP